MLKQMWEKLEAFTISAADGSERDINVRNEWGGFSRRLKMPVAADGQAPGRRRPQCTGQALRQPSWEVAV